MIPKIRVAVTDRCQMRCIYCGGRVETMENFQSSSTRDLSDVEFLQVLEAYRTAGGSSVHLTGGEPLLKPGLPETIGAIRRLGLRVELNTNGLLLATPNVRALHEAGLSLLKVSLDTTDPSRFHQITGLHELDAVLQGIQHAARVLPVRVTAVVLRETIDDLVPLVEFLIDALVPTVYLLDLTYYPTIRPQSARTRAVFFQDQFVNLSTEVVPRLLNHFGGKWRPVSLVYSKMDLDCGFCIVLKEAFYTPRVPACRTCPTYCHEGAFTLRLSTGGYLNFCPLENQHGVDTKQYDNMEELAKQFRGYGEIFEKVKPELSFPKLLASHNLLLTAVQKTYVLPHRRHNAVGDVSQQPLPPINMMPLGGCLQQ